MIECWKCRHEIDVGPKVSFRTVCPLCSVDLHVCKNCRYYAPGKPNDCAVPGSEYVKDRALMNFCEDFALKKPSSAAPDDPFKKAREIFGDDLPKKKNPF